MNLLRQRWFDLGDLETLLGAAEVATEDGRPWTRTECRVWLQAVSEWHDGQKMVRRSKLLKTFPELTEKLGMASDD